MLILGVLGVLLGVDRIGLMADYFAITPHWDNRPVYTQVAPPQVQGVADVSHIFVSTEIFSIRWHGWIRLPESGSYRFDVAADEEFFLRLDGEALVDTRDSSQKKSGSSERYLEKGVHEIELGLAQTGRVSRLHLSWTPPNAESELVPDEILFARRPVQILHLLRRLTSAFSLLQRRVLGALLLLAALLSYRPGKESAPAELIRTERRALDPPGGDKGKRVRRAALLLALFVATWMATVPFTAETLDGDDVRYLDAAFFTKKMTWIVNRYVHVYLLKAFFWIEGGDAFRGSRSLWSFLFATTVTSLAAAAMSLGPGLQLRTLGVVLFLLLSQFELMGSIGAAYPDYTVMMFVAVGVAIYLHGLAHRNSTLWDWHIVALGALTVFAFRSKETGFILTWLAVSFLWHEGRLDVRRCAAKMGVWLIGAGLAWVVVMSLDARFVGDFWFGVRPSNFASLQGMMSAADARSQQPLFLWRNVLLYGHTSGTSAGFALRNLWILVAVAMTVAFAKRKSVEIRILYLMPAVFMLMLFILRPPIFSTRHIWPIVPVACMLGGLLAFDCGIERLRWRTVVTPRFLVPVFLAATTVMLFAGPITAGRFSLAEHRGGPVATALGLLILTTTLIAILRGLNSRVMWLTVCLLLFFGPAVQITRQSLARHQAVQRAQLTLYPWRAFDGEIRAARPRAIQVSPALRQKFQMVGKRKTRRRIARIYFGRPRLRLLARQDLVTNVPLAVGSRRDFKRWQQQAPSITDEKSVDPTGQLVLVRPRKAGR